MNNNNYIIEAIVGGYKIEPDDNNDKWIPCIYSCNEEFEIDELQSSDPLNVVIISPQTQLIVPNGKVRIRNCVVSLKDLVANAENLGKTRNENLSFFCKNSKRKSSKRKEMVFDNDDSTPVSSRKKHIDENYKSSSDSEQSKEDEEEESDDDMIEPEFEK